MPGLTFLFAPLALLLPIGTPGATAGDGQEITPVQHQAREADRGIAPLPLSGDAPAWSPLFDGVAPASSQQVRIERRVILRISPAPGSIRQDLAAPTSRAPVRQRLVERDAASCVESRAIAGVADRGDHLLVYLRDRRMLAARLEKGCSPRDFYQGFYMERSEDGKLCVKRDRLMSRAGAKCQVSSFRELVMEPAQQ